MLQAIQKGKSKLVSLGEDSLTSAVFQLLSYLPNEHLSSIIQNTLKSEPYIFNGGLNQLVSIDFWPRWDATGDQSNKKTVEPDLLMRFECVDIIVEAKRFNEGGQYRQQWENELVGYFNEYSEDKKEVVLWALGGIKNPQNEKLQITISGEKKVVKSTWTMLLSAIKSEYSKHDNATIPKNLSQLFADLIYSFQLHGYFAGTWFGEDGLEAIGHSEHSLAYLNRAIEKPRKGQSLYP